MKYKFVVCLIIVLILIAGQVFVVPSHAQNDNPQNRVYWMNLANNAWRYFWVDNGVNRQTGLHSAGLNWPYFTDWDLGLYIQAIIDAQQLGILEKNGDWGSDARIGKLLSFLENRELLSGLPYSAYHSDTGERTLDPATNAYKQTNACDTGKLLVALGNLKTYNPDLANRIVQIVYEKMDYEPFLRAVERLENSTNIYDYYVACGFAGFWPERFNPVAESILNSLSSAPTVETYGIRLPVAKLTTEVLLHSIFDLKPNTILASLSSQTYSAIEARYNAIGKYSAWSEGNTDLSYPTYVYEWVVYPDGRTWIMKNVTEADVQITPINYFKVAVGLEALYETEFTRSMTAYIESRLPYPSDGYADGVDEGGRIVSTTIDKTNGLVLSAARYAINIIDNPPPSPTPTTNPTIVSPTFTVTPTSPTSTATPSFTSNPTTAPESQTPSPTISPSLTTSPIQSPSFAMPSTTPPENGENDLPFVTIIVIAVCLILFIPTTAIIIKRTRAKVCAANYHCNSSF